MKPAPFDYQAPGTLPEAIDLLASNPEACVIAGGQSLMPVLAFRLATPSLLVDLRRLPGLGNIAFGDDGCRLGAALGGPWSSCGQRLGLTQAPSQTATRAGSAARSRARARCGH